MEPNVKKFYLIQNVYFFTVLHSKFHSRISELNLGSKVTKVEVDLEHFQALYRSQLLALCSKTPKFLIFDPNRQNVLWVDFH